MHGGLSPDIKTLDQIRTIERNQEIPHKGAFCDLVWSDPEDVDTWAISPRGAGWLFGAKVTNEVNAMNLTVFPISNFKEQLNLGLGPFKKCVKPLFPK